MKTVLSGFILNCTTVPNDLFFISIILLSCKEVCYKKLCVQRVYQSIPSWQLHEAKNSKALTIQTYAYNLQDYALLVFSGNSRTEVIIICRVLEWECVCEWCKLRVESKTLTTSSFLFSWKTYVCFVLPCVDHTKAISRCHYCFRHFGISNKKYM